MQKLRERIKGASGETKKELQRLHAEAKSMAPGMVALDRLEAVKTPAEEALAGIMNRSNIFRDAWEPDPSGIRGPASLEVKTYLASPHAGGIAGRTSADRMQEDADRSGHRLALAGQLNLHGAHIEALRVVYKMPKLSQMEGSLPRAESLAAGLPFPSTKEEKREALNLAGEHGLVTELAVAIWQREKQYEHIARTGRELGMYPVFAEPITAGDPGNLTVTYLDRATCESICEGQGARLFYAQTLLSGGGFAKVDTAKGPIRVPDYRKVHGVPVSKDEQQALSAVLELGSFRSDGSCFYVPRDSFQAGELEARLERTVDGEIPDMARAKDALLAEELRQVQFRATQLKARPDGKTSPTFAGKGVAVPLRRGYIQSQVAAAWDNLPELAATVAERTGHTINDASILVAGAMSELHEAAARHEATLFIDLEDQIKTGKERAYRGTMHMMGTNLRGIGPAKGQFRTGLFAIAHQNKARLANYSPVDSLYPEDRPAFAEEIPASRQDDPAFEDTSREGVYHCHVAREPMSDMAQYRPQANSQLTQWLSYEAAGDMSRLAWREIRRVLDLLRTPQGIATLADEQLAEYREAVADGALDGEEIAVREDLDFLRRACLTSLIRLDTKGAELITSGVPREELPYGHVKCPRVLIGRIDKLAASAIRKIMKGFGLKLKGQMHFNVDDDTALLARLNNPDHPGYPWADDSVRSSPQVVTSQVNADDDGDITSGHAGYGVLRREVRIDPTGKKRPRICRELIGVIESRSRYPMIAAPCGVGYPASYPSPYLMDEGEAMARLYAYELPEGSTLSDLTRPARLVSSRIIDVDAHKPKYPNMPDMTVSMVTAIELIRKKAPLSSTGVDTRDQERLMVLAAGAQHRAKQDPSRRPYWQSWVATFADTAGVLGVRIEQVLTIFKKVGRMHEKPAMRWMDIPFDTWQSPHVTEQYPEPMDKASLIRGSIIPGRGTGRWSYHRLLGKLRGGRAGGLQRDVHGNLEFSLEDMPEAEGYGKETKVFNRLRRAAFFGPDGLKEALSSIQTDLTHHITELSRDLPDEITTDEKREAARVTEALELWSLYWRELFRHKRELEQRASAAGDTAMLSEVETMPSRFRASISAALGHVASGVSETALRYAVRASWKEDKTEAEELRRIMQRQDLSPEQKQRAEEKLYAAQNGAAVLAMLDASGRMGELFPLGGFVPRFAREDRREVVFCRGQALPLSIGEVLSGQTTYDKTEDVFVMVRDGQPVILHRASTDDESRAMPEEGQPLDITPLSRCSAVIRW